MDGISCQSVWPKTQYSFSDNPNALGAPENFEITIREVVPKMGSRLYCRFDWGCHDHAWFTKTSSRFEYGCSLLMEQPSVCYNS